MRGGAARRCVVSAKHTRTVFAWLNQVVNDPELPGSAFKVGYVISQHINEETGEAWPGLDTIAEKIGMSEGTAFAGVRSLSARGHLHVTPGRRGSGYSNRYRLIVKPQGNTQKPELSKSRKAQPPEFSSSVAKAQLSDEKAQPAEQKTQPAEMNYFKNKLSNHQGGGLRPPQYMDDEDVDF